MTIYYLVHSSLEGISKVLQLEWRLLIDHSIDGVWEGFFTVSNVLLGSIRLSILKFTEFRVYSALLDGAPPNSLQDGKVVCHRQTWKLREHHLLDNDASSSDSGVEMDREAEFLCPLSPGDPLRSHFPAVYVCRRQGSWEFWIIEGRISSEASLRIQLWI